MRVTQRTCKDEAKFIYMLDAIVADGFDVFSVCQSLDGVWHAWIRVEQDGRDARLDAAVRRGHASARRVLRTIDLQKPARRAR